MAIHGASWARLLRSDETHDPEGPGLGWHLWRNRGRFPHEDMTEGFRYLASEGGRGPGGHLLTDGSRKTAALHIVTEFQDYVPVRSTSDAYTVLRNRFGQAVMHRLIGTRMDWLENAYNLAKTGPYTMLLLAWRFQSEEIEPVDVGHYNHTGTGWKRLP